MSRNPIFKALCLDSDTNNDIATLTILANMAAGEGSSSRHSPRKRRTFIDRDSVQGHNQLFRDYFAESPVYGPNLFRRRFRMSRPLFLRIHDKVQEHDPFFVQTSNCAGRLGLSSLQGNKNKHFAAAQESARKDVERAFGVLQARFAIVRGPARFWNREVLGDIMTACVILHNMIVENERDDDVFNMDFENVERVATVEVTRERTSQFDEFIERHTTQFDRFIERHHRIRETTMHYQLQEDLVEHLWDLHSKA